MELRTRVGFARSPRFANSCPRAHVTSTSRGVIGRDPRVGPRPKIKGDREARCESRCGASLVVRRPPRSASPILSSSHTLSATYTTPAGRGARRREQAVNRTHTPESRVVIISSPAIARWEKRTAGSDGDHGEQEGARRNRPLLRELVR